MSPQREKLGWGALSFKGKTGVRVLDAVSTQGDWGVKETREERVCRDIQLERTWHRCRGDRCPVASAYRTWQSEGDQ